MTSLLLTIGTRWVCKFIHSTPNLIEAFLWLESLYFGTGTPPPSSSLPHYLVILFLINKSICSLNLIPWIIEFILNSVLFVFYLFGMQSYHTNFVNMYMLSLHSRKVQDINFSTLLIHQSNRRTMINHMTANYPQIIAPIYSLICGYFTQIKSCLFQLIF